MADYNALALDISSMFSMGTCTLPDLGATLLLPPRSWVVNEGFTAGGVPVRWESPDLPDPKGTYYNAALTGVAWALIVSGSVKTVAIITPNRGW